MSPRVEARTTKKHTFNEPFVQSEGLLPVGVWWTGTHFAIRLEWQTFDFPSNAKLSAAIPSSKPHQNHPQIESRSVFWVSFSAEVQKLRVNFRLYLCKKLLSAALMHLQMHKNKVATASEAEAKAGVKGRQFLGSFLSIFSDSSQDALGYQGTVSVCLHSNPIQSRSVPILLHLLFPLLLIHSIFFFISRALHAERVKDGQCRPSEVHNIFGNELLWCALANWHHKEL